MEWVVQDIIYFIGMCFILNGEAKYSMICKYNICGSLFLHSMDIFIVTMA